MPGKMTKDTALKVPENIEGTKFEGLDPSTPRTGNSVLKQWIQ